MRVDRIEIIPASSSKVDQATKVKPSPLNLFVHKRLEIDYYSKVCSQRSLEPTFSAPLNTSNCPIMN